jgi:hypothetical protein
MKNTDGGLTGALGLDIVKRAGAAAMKHYCSARCRKAAEEASGGGVSGGGGGDAAAAIAASAAAAQAKAAEAELAQAELAAEQAEKAERAQRKQETIRTIEEISFSGDSAAITQTLSKLLGIVTANKLSTFTEPLPDEENILRKEIRKTALDKMELGILQLRSGGDSVNADFFQQKFEEQSATVFSKLKKGAGSFLAESQQQLNPLGSLKESFGGLFKKK